MTPERRNDILDAAADLFAAKGYRGTSISEIASAAGVAKGTIYLAADSKRDLYYQVLHREIRAGVAFGAARIDPRRPADQLLEPVLQADIEFFDARPLVRDLLLGRAANRFADEGHAFDALRRVARSNFVEVITLGQRQGVFRDDLDAERVAELLQDLEVATLLFHDDVDNVGQTSHPRWKTALALFLDGLRGGAARRPATSSAATTVRANATH